MTRFGWTLAIATLVVLAIGLAGWQLSAAIADSQPDGDVEVETQMQDDYETKAREELTPAQYDVCFLKGTEPPGSGEYYQHFEPGTYQCIVCGNELFPSETKYDSGTGWPAFYDAVGSDALATQTDTSEGMIRVEVMCGKCGAHLGHVFPDGPEPTGQRYCINSLALTFVPAEDDAAPPATR